MSACETRSTCPYCGVGCGVIIESDAGAITGVRGDPEHPANFGRLCSKGSTLHLTAAPHVTLQTRLLEPMQRSRRGGPTEPIGWDAALDLAADRFADTVRRHGPDAVGFYLSGQLLTEDYYVFNKLGKGLVGTNNVDTNSRLCMSSAVAGYKATLGADAPPACYDDLPLAQTVFIAGSNTAWAHPVLFRRLEDARRAKPAQKWIVVDPRRTETAAEADLHLQLLPGTDVALFHGLLHLMLWEGLTDPSFIAEHTTGFAALRDRVREFTPRHVAQTCGLRESDIVQAARWFAGVDEGGATPRHASLSLYCQGLNQSSSGTDKNVALINLHLATGQIGRPGAGPFSLTGQPNAMGGREVGGLANQLSAHRDLADPAHRAEVSDLWGVADVPALPGKTAVEMFQAAADGEIRALWIACTNPAQSLPDQATVRRALERCEFVVVQEAFANTATCAYADLLLPATSWGEKEGTVTNSERRISRVRAAVSAPGEARADWSIGVDFARRLEQRLPRRRADGATMFPYETPESVWSEHRESTRGRDLDITGLDWRALEEPQQWPFPDGAVAGKARLYEDHHFATPDGRARFGAPAWRPVAEPRDARFPVSLNTGRLRDQWHGMSRTGTLGRLFGHSAEPALEMHPQELERRRWRAGDLVRVQSRRGEMLLPVQPSAAVAPAQAFVAMHWGEEFVSGRDKAGAPLRGVNGLTSPALCPQSKQPEFKHAAVRLERVELPWHLVAAAWLPADEVQSTRERLRALMPRLAYASCVPLGHEPQGRVGLLLRAAAPGRPDEDLLRAIEVAFALDRDDVLRYADVRRSQQRAIRFGTLPGQSVAASTLDAFLLAGDTQSSAWLLALLQDGAPARVFGPALLSGSANAPAAAPKARSPQVCNCFDVSESAIGAALAASHGDARTRLVQLQQRLNCGTKCGSCLPAVRSLVQRHVQTTARSDVTAETLT
jgi:assimilatory nitrate reductase catalytic subunit